MKKIRITNLFFLLFPQKSGNSRHKKQEHIKQTKKEKKETWRKSSITPIPRHNHGEEHLDNRKTCSLQPDEMIKAGTRGGLIGLILIKLGGVCGGK